MSVNFLLFTGIHYITEPIFFSRYIIDRTLVVILLIVFGLFFLLIAYIFVLLMSTEWNPFRKLIEHMLLYKCLIVFSLLY